jgi:hypothetical protein
MPIYLKDSTGLGFSPVSASNPVPVSLSGTQVVPSSATNGIQLYNTADQTTNYERLGIRWASNVATFEVVQGGTGTQRGMSFTTQNQFIINGGNATTGAFRFIGTSTSLASAVAGSFSGWTSTATSGTNVGLSIATAYNQASGTAANTDLLVNRAETAVGSGTQRLLSLQVGGTERFGISNAGVMFRSNQTSGPGVATGTLTNAPSAGDPDFWLPITINGTAHWIPAWAA